MQRNIEKKKKTERNLPTDGLPLKLKAAGPGSGRQQEPGAQTGLTLEHEGPR